VRLEEDTEESNRRAHPHKRLTKILENRPA
jgi:hypothetical protein